jgi:hypothetical protein
VVRVGVRALAVRRGDRVQVRGCWREVTAVRPDRFGSGGPALVLVFRSGPSWRVHAAEPLTVEQGGS